MDPSVLAKLEEQWLCIKNEDLVSSLLGRVNCNNGTGLTLDTWDKLVLVARDLYRQGSLPRGFDFEKTCRLTAEIGRSHRLGSVSSLQELAAFRVSSESDDLERARDEPLTPPGEPTYFRDIEYHINRKPPAWIIEDCLPGESIVMFYGGPGSGKSFVALDWSLRIAAGLDWRGKKVKKGKVFYAMLEGSGGLSDRLKAWVSHNGIPVSQLTGFRATTEPIFERLSPAELVELTSRDMELAGGADLFVVDTYSCAIPGKDDVSKEAASIFFGTMRVIRDRFGCTGLFVHHTNKKGDEERGNSSLRGDSDVVIRAKKGSDPISTLKWEKMRDGKDDFSVKYQLKHVSSPEMSEHGSCVVIESYGETRDKIIHSCLKKDKLMSVQEIAIKVGKAVKTIQNNLTELANMNLVEREERGWRLA